MLKRLRQVWRSLIARGGKASPQDNEPDALLLPFVIRPLQAGDQPDLLAVFQDAIDNGSRDDYQPSQRRAWREAVDIDTLSRQLADGEVVVAEWHQQVVGFAHRQGDYLNMLFVASDSQRTGIATLLYQYLEDSARIESQSGLTTHASVTARPFFLEMGFHGDQQQPVERNGVPLQRYEMHKPLRQARIDQKN
ncbi:MAG: GNAT family N-acetyltransferase [Alcanivorax sp.]|nr:GNAT family N-acetyltransferase [Alcanivorax sp.]